MVDQTIAWDWVLIVVHPCQGFVSSLMRLDCLQMATTKVQRSFVLSPSTFSRGGMGTSSIVIELMEGVVVRPSNRSYCGGGSIIMLVVFVAIYLEAMGQTRELLVSNCEVLVQYSYIQRRHSVLEILNT